MTNTITPQSKRSSYVYFSLIGDNFNPDDISKALGLQPTSSQQQGAIEKLRENTFSEWNISTTPGEETIYLHKLIDQITNILSDKIDAINQLKTTYNLDSVLQVVLFVDHNPELPTPALSYETKDIEFLYKTQTRIDIDIYSFDSRDH